MNLKNFTKSPYKVFIDLSMNQNLFYIINVEFQFISDFICKSPGVNTARITNIATWWF